MTDTRLPASRPLRLLVLGDEPGQAERLQSSCGRTGVPMVVRLATTLEETRAQVEAGWPDVVVLSSEGHCGGMLELLALEGLPAIVLADQASLGVVAQTLGGSAPAVRSRTEQLQTLPQLLGMGWAEELRGRVDTGEILKLREAVAQNPVGVAIADVDGVIEYVNESFARALGRPEAELVGVPLQDTGVLAGPEQLAQVGEGDSWRGTCPLVRDGVERTLLQRLSPVRQRSGEVSHVVLIQEDVTDRIAINEHLRQAQKLEALGVFAAGIAHDFNNILTPILGYAQLAQGAPGISPALRKHVERIGAAAERARGLIAQILTFSRESCAPPHPVNAAILIKEGLKLLRSIMPSNVELRSSIDTQTPRVLIDPAQLHQVFMNLATNAYQAMAGGGRLEVELALRQVGPEDQLRLGVERPGDYVCLHVADSGVGIAPDVLPRVLEPFFTTRSPGESSGLGLSIVHGVVTAAGGVVQIESEVGRGTQVTVYLPAAPAGGTGSSAEVLLGDSGEGERVLWVDDDPQVTEFGRDVLELEGYAVEVENDPRRALDQILERGSQLDLVITDQIMPNMLGTELARRVRLRWPDLPILLVTGFAHDLGSAPPLDAVLRKPFTPGELAKTVRALIVGRG